jgi:hypothetical protein
MEDRNFELKRRKFTRRTVDDIRDICLRIDTHLVALPTHLLSGSNSEGLFEVSQKLCQLRSLRSQLDELVGEIEQEILNQMQVKLESKQEAANGLVQKVVNVLCQTANLCEFFGQKLSDRALLFQHPLMNADLLDMLSRKSDFAFEIELALRDASGSVRRYLYSGS